MVSTTYGVIAIGPVQSLIAQARRTQDLWMGSQLLQRLIRVGIDAAVYAGATIITPDLDAVGKDGSIPNRFVFRCTAETADSVIDAARTAVFGTWRAYADKTHSYFTQNLNIAINDAIWQRQIDPKYWLEFYSATVPVEEDDPHFGDKIFSVLMQRLAAQKLVRALPQLPEGEPSFKCSITGEHEALHDQPSGEIGAHALNAYWATVRDHLRNRQHNLALLGEGERLSALSIVKRFGHDANPGLHIERFPSSSSIASANTRYELLRNWQAVRPVMSKYLSAIEGLYQSYGADPYFAQSEILPRYHSVLPENWRQDDVFTRFLRLDGDFLYLDTLQPRSLAEHIGGVQHRGIDRQLIAAARDALTALYRHIRSLGITEPSSYYAVLSMDGDKMGEAAKAFEASDAYHMFSGRLTRFAKDVMRPAIEEEAGGRVVYAGGDDLLALLPLSGVFAAAESIRMEFPRTANNKTISAGIAIVHKNHPLQAAVYAAKRAEHQAKEHYRTQEWGALAFEVLRRSGEPQSGGGIWVRGGISIIDTLTTLRDAMVAEHIAHGLASDLPALLYSVVCTNDPDRARQLDQEDRLTRHYTYVDIPSDLRKLAFKRLFERRCSEAYKKTEKPSNLRDKLERIGEAGKDGSGWHDVAALAYLARFLSQGA